MKSPLPSSFAVKPPDPYVFKSAFKRKLVRSADACGSLFLFVPSKPVEWPAVKRVAVLRLDHLGDVLLSLPALKALRRELPQARIDLWVGPWGKEAAEMAGVADHVRIFETPWFSRPPKGGFWSGSRALAHLLRGEGYDVIIDLRGDFRHGWAAWMSKIPVRIGQTLTGGRFWLTHPVQYDSELHEVEQNLSTLKQAGLSISGDILWPALKTGEGDVQKAEKVKEELGLTQRMIALHPIPATPAKRWFPERWGQLIDGLPKDFDIVMIGVQDDRIYLEEIQKKCGRKTKVVAGLLNLPALAAFLKQCELFIGVDSGPAHIAAAVGIPVVSLFSGTNRAGQWAPWGPQVKIIQKKTECSPCERRECPFENECMRRIEVDEVLKAVQKHLK